MKLHFFLVGFVIIAGIAVVFVVRESLTPEDEASRLLRQDDRSVANDDLPAAMHLVRSRVPVAPTTTAPRRIRVFGRPRDPEVRVVAHAVSISALGPDIRALLESPQSFVRADVSMELEVAGDEVREEVPGTFVLGTSSEPCFIVVRSGERWGVKRIEPWDDDVQLRLFPRQHVEVQFRPANAVDEITGNLRLVTSEADIDIGEIRAFATQRSVWNPRQALQLFGDAGSDEEELFVAFDRLRSAPIDARQLRQVATLDFAGLVAIVVAADLRPMGECGSHWRFWVVPTASAAGTVQAKTSAEARATFVVDRASFPIEAGAQLDADGAPVESMVVDQPPSDNVIWIGYQIPGLLATGQIVDDVGRAIADQTILTRVYERDTLLAESRAHLDANGRFASCYDVTAAAQDQRRFSVIAPGPYGERIGTAAISPTSNRIVELGRIVVTDGEWLVGGETRDVGSRPLSGIRIDVVYEEIAEGTPFGRRSARRSTLTAHDGRFAIKAQSVLRSSKVAVLASSPEYRHSCPAMVLPGTTDLLLNLERAARLVGRITADPELMSSVVLEIAGEPARAFRPSPGGALVESSKCSTRPNSDGTFEFGGLGEGVLDLEARADSVLLATVTNLQLKSSERCKDPRLNPLELRRPAEIVLRVECENHPVERATLWLRSAGGSGPWTELKTDREGSARTWIVEQNVDVICFHPDRGFAIAKDLQTGAVVTLERGPSVTLRLAIDAAVAKADATIDIVPESQLASGIDARSFSIRIAGIRDGETREVSVPIAGAYRVDILKSYEEARRPKWNATPTHVEVSGPSTEVVVSIAAK